ncbi:MAG: glycosyltransferase family 1 protein [Planctomycetota bacterium]|nr:MAG: glycosyltransferase family 1 protein [Planctomycetota bacterium]
MHVLLTIPDWDLIGGTERYAFSVARGLVERGHAVSVLCARAAGPADPAARVEGVRVHVDPRVEASALTADARRGLTRAVRELAPDVVFAQTLRGTDVLHALADAAPFARYVHDHTLFCPGLNKYRADGELCTAKYGLECIKRYLGPSACVCFNKGSHPRFSDALKSVWRRRADIGAHRRAARLFTNSDYMRDELVRAGIDGERVRRVWPFTLSATSAQPAEALSGATRAFVEASSAPLIVTPARLTLPDKGIDYLITALSKLARPWRAVIAGQGPAEAWLREKARAECGERVHFSGWIAQGGIETLYERAAVVVVPSVWNEPFGLVGVEAMAHGRAVVAFRVGGIPEWLDDGVTGFLAPRRDADALAAHVDRLLGDPALAARLGANGRERARALFAPAQHLASLERELEAARASS